MIEVGPFWVDICSMAESTGKLKREKRRVSLEGQDPVEVLKRLLKTLPEQPAKPERPQPDPE